MTKTDAMFWSGETLRERWGPHRAICTRACRLCGLYLGRGSRKSMCRPMIKQPARRRSRCANSLRATRSPSRPASLPSCSPKRSSPSRQTRLPSFRSARRPSSAAWSMSRASCRSGYRGRLTFSVFNAGPVPIHLKRGQPIFLIWYASLDAKPPSRRRRCHLGIAPN